MRQYLIDIFLYGTVHGKVWHSSATHEQVNPTDILSDIIMMEIAMVSRSADQAVIIALVAHGG
ncbi:MAG TPA: hypothetical protein VJ695_10250 [Nitrososphaera sp.]|nr:hypothetical protein [Nitrososphaera sp.]